MSAYCANCKEKLPEFETFNQHPHIDHVGNTFLCEKVFSQQEQGLLDSIDSSVKRILRTYETQDRDKIFRLSNALSEIEYLASKYGHVAEALIASKALGTFR